MGHIKVAKPTKPQGRREVKSTLADTNPCPRCGHWRDTIESKCARCWWEPAPRCEERDYSAARLELTARQNQSIAAGCFLFAIGILVVLMNQFPVPIARFIAHFVTPVFWSGVVVCVIARLRYDYWPCPFCKNPFRTKVGDRGFFWSRECRHCNLRL